ncbi:LCP family protein [Amnibacterium sp.]|uniref:LCP family protein n=1 Tax=Amnibacterium sp. TaxID=1872496 RepID=UPI003F7C7F06
MGAAGGNDERAAPGPPARHASRRTGSIWPALIRRVGIAALVLVVSAVSVSSIAVWRLSRAAGDGAVPLDPKESVPSVTALDGAYNVLLVGADNSSGQSGFGSARQATLNDVNIVIHVSADHTRGTVISLPRDLVIAHPACTDPKTGRTYPALAASMLNVAYERGGLACVVRTAESLTGLTIPYAAKFSFEGTVRMADAVGGVPVCVTKAIDDPKSGLRLPKGVTVITGRTALAYLRERKYLGDGSDLSRIQSQQAYMSALLRKMTSAGTLADPPKLYSLASATAQNVTLSQSMAGLDTMVRMALAVKSIGLDHMVFVQYPTFVDPADTNRVVPDTALASTLVDRVRRDAPIALDRAALSGVQSGASRTASPTASPSASPAPSPSSSSSVIAGLKGRTAAQQTCSIPNR